MKKIIVLLTSILMMTSCTYASSENIGTNGSTEKTTENSVAAELANNISDSELKEMYERAYDMVRGKKFINDGSGKFFTEEGKDLDGYKDEFRQIFTDKYTNEYFKLEKGGVYFDGNERQHLEIYTLRNKNSVDDLNDFGSYAGIWVGLGDRGSDLSVADSELAVTYRSGDKITLTVTVWHTNPDHEVKIGEDYIYRLENGKLIVSGRFGGVDSNGKYIIVEDELSGTSANVPIGKSKYDYSHKQYMNYLVKYDYNLAFEDGKWKFNNFEIWD